MQIPFSTIICDTSKKLSLFRPFPLPLALPSEELFRDRAVLAADVQGSEEFDKSG